MFWYNLWILNIKNHSTGSVREVSNSGPFSGPGAGFSSATDKPQESDKTNDEALPTDCGRDPKKGNGLLCFPVGNLCAESKPNYPCTKVEAWLLLTNLILI